MPGVDYDGDAAKPERRSALLVGAGVALALLLILWRGVAALLVLVWLAVIVAVVFALAYATVRAIRNRAPEGEPT